MTKKTPAKDGSTAKTQADAKVELRKRKLEGIKKLRAYLLEDMYRRDLLLALAPLVSVSRGLGGMENSFPPEVLDRIDRDLHILIEALLPLMLNPRGK